MTVSIDAAAFSAWLDRYKQAWEERDADQALPLFTEDATYAETPFDPPKQGQAGIHDYWADIVIDQREVRFDYELLACAGDTGLAHWRASFRKLPDNDLIEFDGIFRCAFAEDGRVSRFQEWWHIRVTPANGA